MISPTNGETETSSGNTKPAESSKSASLRAMTREAARKAESRIILNALEHHRWNRRRTAEALNISYRSLMYKMKYCKLREDDPARRAETK